MYKQKPLNRICCIRSRNLLMVWFYLLQEIKHYLMKT